MLLLTGSFVLIISFTRAPQKRIPDSKMPKKQWIATIEAKKSNNRNSSTNIMGVRRLLIILRHFYHLNPIKSIIIDYMGDMNNRVLRDCAYHVARLKDTTHGQDPESTTWKKTSIVNGKSIERKAMKRIFLFYVCRTFPNLSFWVKKPETPATIKARKIEVFA